jgi:hypothetical protein
VFAQGGSDTGAISGTISDETGAVLPGVTVTVLNIATKQSRTLVTDEAGRYRVSGLTPSRYTLTAELPGFTTLVRAEVTVNIGAALDLNLILKVSSVAETLTVTGDAPIVQSTKTDLSSVVTTEQMEALPSNGRNYLDFVLLTPASVENSSTTFQGSGLNIGGARAKESALLVDGFYNMDEGFALPRQRYSQDAVQEFQVISLGAAAEFGRAIGGIVNAVTKSGGNSYSGSAFGFFRDKNLNEQTVLEKRRGVPKSEFTRRQFGGTLGGPIIRERTFFFGSVERQTEDTPYDNNITAANARIIGLPAEDAGTIPSFYRLTFAFGKIDHSLSDKQRLQGTFALSRWTEHNRSFFNFGTRSVVDRLFATDIAYQLKWTAVANDWLHELKGAYFPRDYGVIGDSVGGPPLVPEGQINVGNLGPTSAPRVTITNVAIFGSGRLNNHIFTYPVQVLYSSSVFAEKHSIKFGADVMYSKFDYSLYSNLVGAYTFRNLGEYLQGQYASYAQTFGDPRNPRDHKYISAYFQDSWAARDRLTINYGLRYDLELNPKNRSGIPFGNDYNNLGPRFALSYDLTGKQKTFAKVSSGIYYDRLFLNLTTFFYTLKDDSQQISATWLPGQPGAPVYPQTFNEVPADLPAGLRNVWVMPDKVNVPTSGQIVVTLDHAFAADLAVSASLLYNRSWHKEIGWDVNLAFDEATQRWIRPDLAYRQINQRRFDARADYTGFALEVIKRAAQSKLMFTGNLTVARSFDEGDNYGNQPVDLRFREQEWGPTIDTPTVRGVISGAWQLNRFMQVSAIYRARTGYAYDARAGSGFDLNGDGQFNDRTPGFRRNEFRAPHTQSIDARFAWVLPVGDKRLQFYFEGFNILNTENIRTVNGTYGPTPGSPLALFGQPLSYFPPRELQLGLRFTF